MTSNFFSGPDIGIVSCQPRLGTNVKIWKVKMWGGMQSKEKMFGWKVKMCILQCAVWIGEAAGEMWTLLNFSHVTRLAFHSAGKSKQIGSHVMVEIYLLVSRGCERWNWRGGGRDMKWVGCLTWNVIAAAYMWGPTMREHVKYEFENLFRHILMKLDFCKCDFEKRI